MLFQCFGCYDEFNCFPGVGEVKNGAGTGCGWADEEKEGYNGGENNRHTDKSSGGWQVSEVKFLGQIGGEWCQGVKIFWNIMGHVIFI